MALWPYKSPHIQINIYLWVHLRIKVSGLDFVTHLKRTPMFGWLDMEKRTYPIITCVLKRLNEDNLLTILNIIAGSIWPFHEKENLHSDKHIAHHSYVFQKVWELRWSHCYLIHIYKLNYYVTCKCVKK